MIWIIKRNSLGAYYRGPELNGSVYSPHRREAMRFKTRWEAYERLAQCIRANHCDFPRVVRIRTVSPAAKRERAAITAWLRTLNPAGVYPLNCADMIEKGYHTRGPSNPG